MPGDRASGLLVDPANHINTAFRTTGELAAGKVIAQIRESRRGCSRLVIVHLPHFLREVDLREVAAARFRAKAGRSAVAGRGGINTGRIVGGGPGSSRGADFVGRCGRLPARHGQRSVDHVQVVFQ